jgi:hypothetical protein
MAIKNKSDYHRTMTFVKNVKSEMRKETITLLEQTHQVRFNKFSHELH